MRISLRLTIGFLVIGLLVAAVGYFTVSTNRLIQTHMETLGRGSIIELADSHQMALALNACHVAAYQLVAVSRTNVGGDGDDKKTSQTDVERTRQTILASRIQFNRSLERSRPAAESLSDWALQHGDLELATAQRAKIDTILNTLRDRFADHCKLLDEFLDIAGKDPDAAANYLS